MRVLGRFVLYFALPALLFRALSQRHITEIVNTSYIAAYLGGTLAMVAMGLVLASLVLYLLTQTEIPGVADIASFILDTDT